MKTYNSDDLYNKLRKFIDLPESVIDFKLIMNNNIEPVIEITTYANANDDDSNIGIDLDVVIDSKFALIDFDDLELFKEFKKNRLENILKRKDIPKNYNLNINEKEFKEEFEGVFIPLSFNEINLTYHTYRKPYQLDNEWYILDRSDLNNPRTCGKNMRWVSESSFLNTEELGELFTTKQDAEDAARLYFTGENNGA